ncbi:MAG TPA: hypothetical protein PK156_06710 [Polyangium sp.]|nr:hypothetical protein [Polyangium sp.]
MAGQRVRYQLTIRAERSGDDLVCTYVVPGFGVVGERRVPLAAVGTMYRVGDDHGLLALSQLLARGEESELAANLRGVALDQAGAALFEAFFGDEPAFGPVLRRAFQRLDDGLRVDPIREALRVRICTQDPRLQGLPLRAMMYGGRLLMDQGWTFEYSRDEQPAEQREFSPPGRILVVAPDYESMPAIGTDAHVSALRRLIESLVPGHTSSPKFRVVQEFREVSEALAGMNPDIVYYYGHGESDGEELFLLLGEAAVERIPIRKFAQEIKKYAPSVVVLNGCKTGQAGLQSGGHQLLPEVPIVVSNATTAFSSAASEFAMQWIRAWLEEGRDPIESLHDLDDKGRSTLGFEWLTPVVHANYSAFKTRAIVTGPSELSYLPPEWLNREEQRSRVFGHVSDLARDSKRRVMALVGMGTPGNRLDLLSKQIIDRIEVDGGERLRIQRIPLTFPAERIASFSEETASRDLGARIAAKLRTELRTDGPIVLALKARAARRTGMGMPIVWLDWQVFAGEAERASDRWAYLDSESLLAWLRFVRDQLAPDCPDDLRIVAMLSLEFSFEKLAPVADVLKSWESDSELGLRTPRFRFRRVSPLGEVKQDEILDYLEHADCPIATELSELLYRKTAGQYEQTVEYLRRGTPTWHALRDELVGRPKEGRSGGRIF